MFITSLYLLIILSGCWLPVTTCPSQCKCEGSTVDCSNLDLSRIPQGIPYNTSRLILYGNSIQRIQRQDFENLSSLTVLDLTANFISSVEPASFGNLNILTVLKLDENRLENVSAQIFEGLLGLRVLTLNRANAKSSMQLTIAERTFMPLVSMDILELQNNNLHNVTMEMLFGLERLKVLKLSSNKLRAIDNRILTQTTSLLSIDISENPLICTCELIGWISKAKQGASIYGTCDSPWCLKGRSLVDARCTDMEQHSECNLGSSLITSTSYFASPSNLLYTDLSNSISSGNVQSISFSSPNWVSHLHESNGMSMSTSMPMMPQPSDATKSSIGVEGAQLSVSFSSFSMPSSWILVPSLKSTPPLINVNSMFNSVIDSEAVLITSVSTSTPSYFVNSCAQTRCLQGNTCGLGSTIGTCTCTAGQTGFNCTVNPENSQANKPISLRTWIVIVVVFLAFGLAFALTLTVTRQKYHFRFHSHSPQAESTDVSKSLDGIALEEDRIEATDNSLRFNHYGLENPVYEHAESPGTVRKDSSTEIDLETSVPQVNEELVKYAIMVTDNQ